MSVLVAGGWNMTQRRDSGALEEIVDVDLISTNALLANKKLAKLPIGVGRTPSLFVHGEHLLICGGNGNINGCLKLDNGTWTRHSTLNNDRGSSSAVTTNDGTYIFGAGFVGGSYNYEFLPKNSAVWQAGKTEIPDGFWLGCAVEVPGKNQILLIGGINDSGKSKRILKFDTVNEEFEELNVFLQNGRHRHTCARLPNTNLIVIAGGEDSSWNKVDTTEILNLEDTTITPGNAMNTKRSSHGMGVITIGNEDRLAVFGNYGSGNDSFDLETLNPSTKMWEVSNLNIGRLEEKFSFGYISLPNDFISNL